MPYFEVDQSVIDGLEDEVKAKFASYEPEDVSGLKNKANEAVNEAKTAKSEVKKLQADLAEAKINKPAGDADKVQQELDSALEKLSTVESSYTDLQKQIVQTNINGEAGKLAATLTTDTKKAQLLSEKIANRLSFDDGELKVLDNSGKLTISGIDDLATEIKSEYAFLVDGSPASGGGATGARGGAVADTKEMGRSDFEKLDHVGRARFTKEGGKVINE